MGKGKLSIIVIVFVAFVMFGKFAEKDKRFNDESKIETLKSVWKERTSQIDTEKYPSINESGWCGLSFGEQVTAEQSDFKKYLDKHKEDTLIATKSLPSSDLYGNLSGYKRLSCMEPENQHFLDKVGYYENQIELANKKNLERINSAWSYRISVDEMTQERSVYLSSKIGTTTRSMSFPYTGTESAIYFGCNKKSKWAYFWFSNQPNIVNDQTKSGYSLSKSRIRFDDALDSITMTQDWGSKFMHARYPDWLSNKLVGVDNVRLELHWHGEGRAVFSYDVSGFKSLYSDFIKECSAL